MTRYAHQTGHHVSRRFGWDTHGLPIEFEIDKKLGVKTRADVLKMGIPQYNAECRSIVMTYADQWKEIVSRLGRWIDMETPYKTLDLSFMESVWWVFQQIFNKQMVYRGFKVMPYSTGCSTPLSNFEANLNYKDTEDPSVIVSFPLEEDPNVKLLAWTTTPWTLPSNLAVTVNGNFTYVKIKDKKRGEIWILSEERLGEIYPQLPKKGSASALPYEVMEKFTGRQLEGKKYIPLFDYFHRFIENGAFRVLVDDYVTNESGTGIVHCAPAFGEDDYRVAKLAGIVLKGTDVPCPVDASGLFTDEVAEFAGKYVKGADAEIMKVLAERGRVVKQTSFVHSYPFCWRSETPLIYKAVPCWFIKVEELRDRLTRNNLDALWVPEFVQKGRFANWLADACDWAVSRNRFWGTPLPIWASEDYEEIICVGSVDELFELSGVRVSDLHRESIDHITIPSKKGKGVLKRVEEVFDCWFESGSMPFAQVHYPFENKQLFENTFPADFIAEGIDQPRGWFYTLLVISTILFDKVPFKNLIVNGLVLASDGKKMSKRLKNYPDPILVVNKYGADALRLYLINSPVVRAENLKFQEEGVRSILKDVFLPWFNAYRFLVQSVHALNKRTQSNFVPDFKLALATNDPFDRWIIAVTNSLVRYVREEMKAYRLYTVVPHLVKFVDQLTNWYVRVNRKRFKGALGDDQDCRVGLCTFFDVLYTMCRTMAPFTPFLVEHMYQNLKLVLPEDQRVDSVHYLDFPQVREGAEDDAIEQEVALLQNVIELLRASRTRRKIPIKYPLSEVIIIQPDAARVESLQRLSRYVEQELNVRRVIVTSSEGDLVKTRAVPNFKALGERLKKDQKKVTDKIKLLSHEEIRKFQADGSIVIDGYDITSADVQVVREFNGSKDIYEPSWDNQVLVVLNVELTNEFIEEGITRELLNFVQKIRKRVGLQVSDRVNTFVTFTPQIEAALKANRALLHSVISSDLYPLSLVDASTVKFGTTTDTLWTGEPVEVLVAVQAPFFGDLSAFGNAAETLKGYFLTFDYRALRQQLETDKRMFARARARLCVCANNSQRCL